MQKRAPNFSSPFPSAFNIWFPGGYALLYVYCQMIEGYRRFMRRRNSRKKERKREPPFHDRHPSFSLSLRGSPFLTSAIFFTLEDRGCFSSSLSLSLSLSLSPFCMYSAASDEGRGFFLWQGEKIIFVHASHTPRANTLYYTLRPSLLCNQ